MNEKILIDELIKTIKEELEQSSLSKYICNDGTIIYTDVGYVEEWFWEYVNVLRKRYIK